MPSKSKSRKSSSTSTPWWQQEETPEVVLEEGTPWYSMYSPKKAALVNKSQQKLAEEVLRHVETHFNREVTRYHRMKKRQATSDEKWMHQVIKTGTLSDKVAALALKVQASPLHELETLDILVAMAHRKEQRNAQCAIEALKDLLIHNLLPDRKLIPFRSQDLSGDISLSSAMIMYFEEKLISRVSSIVDALDHGLKSTVDFYKKFCMSICSDWLIAKPEQERRLLIMLVHKLGDHTGGADSKATQLLTQILHQHPAMKETVAKEVQEYIHRPNLPIRHIFSGVLFLNQIYITAKDSQLAAILISIYIGLFEKTIQQNDLSSKMLTSLLNGINKCYPHLRDKSLLEKHLDAIFKIVHVSSFATATQALLLISFVALQDTGKSRKSVDARENSNGRTDVRNRFYRALYEKLQAEQVMSRARNGVFLNLLYRSIKSDPSDTRVVAFIKRLCILCCHASSHIAAGLLFLVSEIFSSKPHVLSMLTETPSAPSDDESDMTYADLGNYDALKREPEYASQGLTSSWELCLLRSHFHPSVSAFVKSIMVSPHKIKFEGDPTIEFSLTSFLNRFSYKNAKAGKTKALKSRVAIEDSINSSSFIRAPAQSIAPDKAFFHKFFGSRIRMMEQGLVKMRFKKSNSNPDVDHEEEMDRFADELAENLITSGFEDPDMDDYDNLGSFDTNFHDNDAEGNFEDEYEARDSDEGRENIPDDTEYEIEEPIPYGDTDLDARSEEAEINASQNDDSKAKRKRDDFADAEEYEEIMDEIVQFHTRNGNMTEGAALSKEITNRRQASKRRRK